MKRLSNQNGQPPKDEIGEVDKLTYDPILGKHIRKERRPKFIKGPIPFEWMQKANALSGHAGRVGVALWFLSGVKQSLTFSFTAEAETLSGGNRKAYYKGLAELEEAKLIHVERMRGRRPIVTILQ